MLKYPYDGDGIIIIQLKIPSAIDMLGLQNSDIFGEIWVKGRQGLPFLKVEVPLCG